MLARLGWAHCRGQILGLFICPEATWLPVCFLKIGQQSGQRGVLTLSQHPQARILDHGTKEILTPKLASSRVLKGPRRNLDVPLSGRKLRPPRPHVPKGSFEVNEKNVNFRFTVLLVYTARLYCHFYVTKPSKVKISARLACKNEGKPCFFVYTTRLYPHFYESKPPEVEMSVCSSIISL